MWTKIVLEDVHALHGGQLITVNSSGEAEVVEVLQGARHARIHKGKVPSESLEALTRLLQTAPLRALVTSMRMGVAGEGRPTLILTRPTGAEETASKWSNDSHKEFDQIASTLMNVAKPLLKESNAPTVAGTWNGQSFVIE